MTASAQVNILLVDDEPKNLVVLEAILGSLGENLVRATSGQEALRHVLDSDFAAILLDVRMPSMDGFETAKLIRTRPQSKTTPIIFLTAADGSDLATEEAYALGAVDYLTKPVVPAVLKAKVSFFVELYRSKEELRVAERRALEATFREQKEFWQTTLSSIGDAVIATDTEQRVTFLNAEAERLTGWTRPDAAGRALNEVFAVFNEATRERIECPVEKVLRTGRVVGLANHTVLVARDGTEKPIDDSAAPIRDASGAVYGVVLVFRDITEKRHAEDALRRKEAELTDFVENATVGLHWVGPDGTILWANRAELDLLGFSREEYIGHKISEFHADTPVIEDILCRLGNNEELHSYEARLRCKDGSIRNVLISSNVYREAGEFRHTRCFTRDVTERKRAEEALARSEARNRAVVYTAIDCIIGMDHEGRITEFNPAAEKTFGYDRAEVLGKAMDAVIIPREHQQGHRAGLARYLATGEDHVLGRRLALPAVRKGGERFACELSITRNPGEPPSFTGFLRDVTERNRAEEHLKASELRFRTLFESMGEGFCVVEMIHDEGGRPVDYRFLEVNPTFEKHTGLKDAVGKTICELVPGHDAHWFEIFGQVAATGEPTRFVNEARAMGRWYDVYAYRLGGSESRRVAILFSDISDRKRADDRLRESEERLRNVTDTARVGLVIVDEEHRYRFANRAYGEILGLPPENLAGRRIADVLAAVYEDQIRPRLERAFAGERVTYELTVPPPPGANRGPRICTVAYEPQTDHVGGRQVVVVIVDVTERREAEAAVQASEGRFRHLAETIPNLAWMAKPDGSIFWYNRRWYEYTGTTLSQMEGWGWQSVHDPDELANVLVRWKESIATGKPFNMVFPLKGSDGLFRPFLTLVNPLRDPGGEILYWFGTNTDISEQKRHEEELSRSAAAEKHRSTLLARVGDASKSINAVLSVDSITRILSEEARGILGTHVASVWITRDGSGNEQPKSAVSLSDKYAIHRGRAVSLDGFCARVCRTNSPLRLTETEVEADSEWDGAYAGKTSGLPIRGWLGVPIVDHGGKNRGVLQLSDKEHGEFTQEDEAVLTQLAAIASVGIENARLYDALRDQDRRKDEFLATLAHELRNPLAPVRTGLEILKVSEDKDRSNSARAMMERQLGHMVRLVDDLMDVSRVSRGKVDIKKERLLLRTVVDAALETSRPLVEAARHELTVSLPEAPLYVNGDLTRLAQVLSNLLNNAVKYTPEGGHIGLSAARDGEDVVVTVTDTGVGIPRDMLPKVFDLFTQVGRTIDRSQGGLGIGLSLVMRLVELHGGSVSADSPGPGQGSTFTVRLPVATRKDEVLNTSNVEGSRAGQERAGHRILVVDDNVDGAESLAMLLDISGHVTRTAHSGPAALSTAREFRPDVVFLDLGLPGMNGYEVAATLRGDPVLGKVVLIALTGWGSNEDRKRSRDVGFDFHLVKPVDAVAVEQALARFLQHGE